MEEKSTKAIRISRDVSPLFAWALSFGCIVGWGSFMMPGTTFLPMAGPLGTMIAMFIGAIIMLILGVCFRYMMERFPDDGGVFTYAKTILGYDQAFLAAWSLGLAYLSLIWANATAFIVIGRYMLGNVLQFGFHYSIAGYDIYFGEIVVTILILYLFGFIACRGGKTTRILHTFLSVLLFALVVLIFLSMFPTHHTGALTPPFSDDMTEGVQVLHIVMLAPWMFVGFEAASLNVSEFTFSVKKTYHIMAIAVLTGALTYILLNLIATTNIPPEYENWQAYIDDLNNLSGVKAAPVLNSVRTVFGRGGLMVLIAAAIAALSTSLLGYYRITANLMQNLATDGILPEKFAKRNRNGVPQNAVILIMLISSVIPFLGRTAIGWLTDITTITVSIAYCITAVCCYKVAAQEQSTKIRAFSIAGICISILFCLFPITSNLLSERFALATESYMLLAVWSILGFIAYWVTFRRDENNRFGKSTAMWMVMMFLILFSSALWMRQITHETVMNETDGSYETIGDALLFNSMVQMALIAVSLAILFNIFSILRKREKELDTKMIRAEESSRAKTVFLSNMSHDIRTPMNAIIGYINLAERDENHENELREYLAKIKTSSHHLLALINDVLEMSRIESGKMDLEPIAVDLQKTLNEVRDMFSTQMEVKHIDFTVSTDQIKNSCVYCDKNRLNRVLLNLLSNAYKFTPEGGAVTVSAWQIENEREGFGKYELRVKDSGIGMTEEFAAKVFEAFERERTSTVSGIQGTGLGMAITKSIIDLMGGTIEVNTAPDQGTEFVIRLELELQKESASSASDAVLGDANSDGAGNETRDAKTAKNAEPKLSVDFSTKRLLLVEDMAINREIALMILGNLGFTVETAENGQEAIDKVAASEAGYFDAVLMDIQMPVKNGYEAAEGIRNLPDETLSKIPIVAMTANAFSEDVKKAHDVGMNGHIAKPIDVTNLTNTL